MIGVALKAPTPNSFEVSTAVSELVHCHTT